jgi:hypothetical protein
MNTGQKTSTEITLSLLTLAYGDDSRAEAVLGEALSRATRDCVPSGAELLAFAGEYLRPLILADLGDLIADAVLAQLRLQVGAPEAEPERPSSRRPLARISVRAPSSTPAPQVAGCIMLIDEDNFRRTTLARALLRKGYRVLIADRLQDVSDALRDIDRVDGAVVDARHPRAYALVDALASCWPGAAILLLADSEAAARLGSKRGMQYEVCSPTAPTQAVVEDVARMLLAAGRRVES